MKYFFFICISNYLFFLQEKRVNCHSLFEDALAKLKSSKDVTAFQVKV